MGEGNRRNQPCHCGSGKKYKDCHLQQDQTPRVQGFTFVPAEGGVVTGIELGPAGQIRLLSGDQNFPIRDLKVAEWRETQSGIKRNSQIDVPDDQAFVHPEAAFADAHYVFGVDTNQIETEGGIRRISCLTCATRKIRPEGYEGSIQQILAIDFVDHEHPAERIGWLIAIESLKRSGWDGKSKTIICTDHDVNAHTAINQRVEPIIDGYFLPENITLMYARDRGSSIPNKLISAAHKGAKAVEKAIRDGDTVPQRVMPDLLGQVPRGGLRIWSSEAYKKYFDPDAKD